MRDEAAVARQPKKLDRVLIVTNREDHIARGYGDSFKRLGINAKIFDLGAANSFVDKYIFHAVNHWLHNFRVLKKSDNLFESSRYSHKNYRSRKLLDMCKAFSPDLVFHIRSWTVLPEVLEEIRRQCALFGWWIEGDHRLAEVLPDIKRYDKFYFFSTSCVDETKAKGFERIGYLPHAIDAEIFHPIDNASLKYDWAFVGKWTEGRQRVVEKLASVSPSFAIYGPGWDKKLDRASLVFPRLLGRDIWGDDLVRLYNSSKVILNITQWSGANRGMNARILEVLACAGCLLTDYTDDLLTYFTPGVHLEVYRDEEACANILRQLLEDEDRRTELASGGLDVVRRKYSFDHRVQKILSDYEEFAGKAA